MTPTQRKRALHALERHLELRNVSARTASTYLGYARRFVEHVDKPLGRVTRKDVEDYLLAMRKDGKSASTRNVTLTSIRALLRATRSVDVTAAIPMAKTPRHLVAVISGSEVEQLLGHTRSPKYRAIFMLAYGAGLRIGEIRHLRIDDIDSRRGLIHVRDGKTGERYVPLGRRVLAELRAYYRARRPPGPYLFPGRGKGVVLTRAAISQVLKRVVKEAGIGKRITPHTFRHTFATHLLDTGTDIRSVQLLLGHASLESTAKYLHVSRARLAKVPSPLDLLGTKHAHRLG